MNSISNENDNDEDKIYKLFINYLYSQTLKDFCENGGKFRQTYFWLLKSICDEEIVELMYEKFNVEYQHKIIIVYIFYLNSNYFKTKRVDFLISFKEKLFDIENEKIIPSQYLSKLKLICLKKIAYLLFVEKDENAKHLHAFLSSQSEILDKHNDVALYREYTNEKMIKELCDLFKSADYVKHESVLMKLAKHFDDLDNDKNDLSMRFIEFLDSKKQQEQKQASPDSSMRVDRVNTIVDETKQIDNDDDDDTVQSSSSPISIRRWKRPVGAIEENTSSNSSIRIFKKDAKKPIKRFSSTSSETSTSTTSTTDKPYNFRKKISSQSAIRSAHLNSSTSTITLSSSEDEFEGMKVAKKQRKDSTPKQKSPAKKYNFIRDVRIVLERCDSILKQNNK